MNSLNRINYLLFIFLISVSSQIYSQISVKLQQPPPYQFKIEQFWKVIITNSGGAARGPISVFLRGTATESLQGKIIEATSSVITLQPGVKIISGRMLGPFTIKESNSRFTDIRSKTGSVPSGNYKICITVFNAKGGEQLASDCIKTTVENFNRMELISPIDREVIGNMPAENKENLKIKRIDKSPLIIFSWLPPVPAPSNVRIRYRLKIVEMLGYQSVHSAMASNPFYYQSNKISSTMLRYPVAAKPLKRGSKYAWAVEAYIDDFKVNESEIRSFKIAGIKNKEYKKSSKDRQSFNRFGQTEFNQYSGLPSGLSIVSNKNFGPHFSNIFTTRQQDDIVDKPSNFKFYGDAKFTQVASSQPPQFSQLPVNYWTLEINPRVSIYNIPFGMNIYLSSLNNSSSQSINTFSFVFDNDQLKSKITDRISEKIEDIKSSVVPSIEKPDDLEALNDPNKLAENADKLGLISSAEKFFLDLKSLGIGRTYPEYSELTVSGVEVNGLNLEYNPGIFYLAAAAWNNLHGIDDVSFKRSFFAGRLGVGKKENEHLFFTLLKMKDDINSIQISSSNTTLTPQENVVIGSEGKLKLFKNLVELSGEAALSGFTRDLNDADFVSGSIPGIIQDLLTPKLSTSHDYAWKGKIAFNNEPSATILSLGLRRIGTGFISLGAPNLRQDQFQFDFNFDQKFSDRKIILKTFYKVYNDNLTNWKQSTTTTISYGINLGFYFPNIPFVQINYSPYTQSNENVVTAPNMENRTDLFTFMTGHSYQISNVFASTTLSFTGQWQNTTVGINSSKFSNTTYMLNQNFSFQFPLTLSSTFSFTRSKILSVSSKITEFDLSGDYSFNEKISANLGTTISNEENFTKRTYIYMGANFILSEWLRLELQGNYSNYVDLSGVGNDYNDKMLQATVAIIW